jgi:micrococcal nuclease
MRMTLLVLALAAAATALVAGSAARSDAARLHGTVSYVVDGDTLQVRLVTGARERVRLIGIDTPEVGECGARDATASARRLAHGRKVVLVTDSTQDRRDRYGRLLAYAWIDGKADLGFQQLARGHARVYVYARPFARLGAYRLAEGQGKRLAKSIWRCRTPGAAPAPTSAARRGCDPSYPTVCIAPPPPDLDCRDVPHRRFRVVGRDPHRFDGDGNGIGCERP